MPDKRSFQRFKRRMTVHFEVEGQPYVGVTRDVSQTGMFVLCHHTPKAGTPLTILVKLPAGGDSRVHGRVVRAQRAPAALAGSFPSGFGFMLTSFSPQLASLASTSPVPTVEPPDLDTTSRKRQSQSTLPNVVRVLVGHPEESVFTTVRDALSASAVAHFSVSWAGTLAAVEKAFAAGEHEAALVGGRFGDVGHVTMVRRARRDGWTRPLFVLQEWDDPAVEAAVLAAGASGVLDRRELDPKTLARWIRQAYLRERALESLAEWEPRCRALTTALSDGVVVGDEQGRITFWSRGAQRIFGREETDVLRRPLLGLFAEDVRPALAAAIKADENGVAGTAEEPIQALVERPDGSPAAVELTVSGYRAAGVPRPIVLVHDVRERRELEEAVLGSEAEWRELYEKAPVGYVSLDAEGYVMLTNETLARWLGVRKDDVLGRPLVDLLEPAQAAPFQELVADLKSSEQAEPLGPGRELAVGLRRPEGPPLPARLQLTAARADDGALVSMLAVVIDETQRRDGDRKAGRLAALVDDSLDAIFTCDPDGRVLTWNRAAERISGRSAGEMMGNDLLALIPPPRAEDLRAALQRVAGDEALPAFETVWVGREGQLVEVSLVLSPMHDGPGAVGSISGIARDVTARNRADRELRRLRKAVETMQVGLTITDPRGRILYVNRAGAAMCGYAPEELVGQDVGILSGAANRRVMSDDELRALSSWRRQSSNLRKDGTRLPVRLVSDVVLDVSGRPIGIVTISEAVEEAPATTS